MHYIYKTTNTINNRVYIGQRHVPSHGNIERDSYLGSGTLLLDAIKRYGRVNFTKEILHICETQKQTDELEIDEIRKHRKELGRINVYNMSNGGQFWREDGHSEQVSKSMKAYYAIPENKQRYIEQVNKKRIAKGLPTTQARKVICEQEKQMNRERSKQKLELQKMHTALKKIARKNFIHSDEHKNEVSQIRKRVCKEVFYREDVLEKFKAGIKARDSRPEYKAQRKINAQIAANTKKLRKKIAVFGSDHSYYLTSGEFAKYIGVTPDSLRWSILAGKYKPDAYIKMTGKQCAVFDIRLHKPYNNQEMLF